jgi:hypothetical protein
MLVQWTNTWVSSPFFFRLSSSRYKRGDANNGVQFSPLSSLQPLFNTLRRTPFLAPWRIHREDAVLPTTTGWNTARVNSCDASAKRFARGQRRKMCVGNEGEFVENFSLLSKGCTHDNVNVSVCVVLVPEALLSYRPSPKFSGRWI